MLNEEIPKHRKYLKNKSKPFAIEYKRKDGISGFFKFFCEWSIFKRYRKLSSAMEAIIIMRKKEDNSNSISCLRFIYRFDKNTQIAVDKFNKEK